MAKDRLTLCLSLGKTAPSQYGNYNFRGMCKFGDKLLGGNEDGVFVLDSGDTDNGTKISAFLRTGPTDFGAEEEKRLRRLYLSFRTDGRMKMGVSGDGKEDVSQEITPANTDLDMIHQKVSGGRDIRGKYLDLKLENVQGSDFTINEVKAVLVILGANTVEGA
jgi:hypothetical protein